MGGKHKRKKGERRWKKKLKTTKKILQRQGRGRERIRRMPAEMGFALSTGV